MQSHEASVDVVQPIVERQFLQTFEQFRVIELARIRLNVFVETELPRFVDVCGKTRTDRLA